MRGGERWDVGNIIAYGRDDPAEVSASCDLSVGCSSGEVPEDWRGGPTTLQEFRLDLHKHARFTLHGRALLVEWVVSHGLRMEAAAHTAGVSGRTAHKWLRRFREEGVEDLQDRYSAPDCCPHATSPE